MTFGSCIHNDRRHFNLELDGVPRVSEFIGTLAKDPELGALVQEPTT